MNHLGTRSSCQWILSWCQWISDDILIANCSSYRYHTTTIFVQLICISVYHISVRKYQSITAYLCQTECKQSLHVQSGVSEDSLTWCQWIPLHHRGSDVYQRMNVRKAMKVCQRIHWHDVNESSKSTVLSAARVGKYLTTSCVTFRAVYGTVG